MKNRHGGEYRVVANRQLTHRTWRMRIEGDTSMLSRPGQFVNIEIPGRFLRRPISVSDYDTTGLTLLYDVVGDGTAEMSRWEPGRKVGMLNGLGDGFDTSVGTRHPLLLGGGIGVAPLVGLARELVRLAAVPTVVLGFNSEREVVTEDMFRDLGLEPHIATVDGSRGFKGFVTDLALGLGEEFDYVYACGPTPMLRAVSGAFDLPGQLSLESRMGCGFGACMCCSIELRTGPARICKEGPVFKMEDVIWK